MRSWKEVKLKYRVIERFRGKYSIEAMCKVFGVSRSGYYDWRNRQDKPNKDQWLLDLITQAQIASKQTYGHRRIQRWLLRKHKKYVNLKVILRVMRHYDLLSKIRRVRPYMQYQKALHKYPNLLDRQFEQVSPNRFWVTDITYIPTAKGMVYMCAVMDLCGKMVLAYRIGTDMTTSLVTDTIRDAKQKEMVTDGLALHSDQGSQYTSQAYFDLIQSYHIQPSMSSPGCPYDNSAMENFFGNLKTECLHRMKFSCKAEVEQAVAEYVQFYNFERINMKNGLTPFEIRSKAA
ncbi:MAG: IS3 family transposase [Ruminococcaceae bacterium]|nr:IS3 family transposase [Oscillospiraceae bacterium]